MATFNYLNNAIGQLFDMLEGHTGTEFATFTMNEPEHYEDSIDGEEAIYMQQYQSEYDEPSYKYIYDPDLNFDDQFHQRLASVQFKDREQPWVTIMFNTGALKSLTNVVSTNQYVTIPNSDGDHFEIKTKRVAVPIKMVLVSNDISTLYAVTEQLALFWDRIVNFSYCEFIQFPTGTEDEYEKTGQAMYIREVDLKKPSMETQGTLVSTAYTFDLVYWVTKYPKQCHVLEKIVVKIASKQKGDILSFEVR